MERLRQVETIQNHDRQVALRETQRRVNAELEETLRPLKPDVIQGLTPCARQFGESRLRFKLLILRGGSHLEHQSK